MIQRAASWPGPGDCSPRNLALSLPKYCPQPVRIRSESPGCTSTPCALAVASRCAAVISKPGASGAGPPPAGRPGHAEPHDAIEHQIQREVIDSETGADPTRRGGGRNGVDAAVELEI